MLYIKKSTLGYMKEFLIFQPFSWNSYAKWIKREPGIESWHVLGRLWGLNIGQKAYYHACITKEWNIPWIFIQSSFSQGPISWYFTLIFYVDLTVHVDPNVAVVGISWMACCLLWGVSQQHILKESNLEFLRA